LSLTSRKGSEGDEEDSSHGIVRVDTIKPSDEQGGEPEEQTEGEVLQELGQSCQKTMHDALLEFLLVRSSEALLVLLQDSLIASETLESLVVLD